MFRLVLLILCCVAMVVSMEDTAREKRLVLHSDEDVAAAFQTMAAQMHSMNATIESLKNDVQARDTTIQAMQTSVQSLQAKVDSRDATIQAMQTTSQSLLSTIQLMQSMAQSRDSTVESMQTEIESIKTEIESMQTAMESMQTAMESMQSMAHARDATIQSPQTELTTGQGSTYIRWGRTDCQTNGTELVYKGFAGGSLYSHEGGAADYICLTQEPLWGNYTGASASPARVYGTEYEVPHTQSEALFGQSLQDHDVPCAVCRPQRATTVMIPGRNKCYPGWTEEYAGYLVSGLYGHDSASNYACLDIRPELVRVGDKTNDNGHLMYVAETVCGALKCPPYFDNRVITCVVCSR